MESVPAVKLFASVVIRQGNRALVFEEKDDKGELKYNLPGGHVDPGETPVEAAVREVKEEAGISVAPLGLLQVTVNTWSKTHSLLLYFSCVIEAVPELHTEPGITASWKTADEVAALPSERFVFGAKEAIARSFDNAVLDPDALLIRKNGDRIDWSAASSVA